MKPFTELRSWAFLNQRAQFFPLSANPFEQKNLHTSHINLDISNQQVDAPIFELLLELADERHLKAQIDAMMRGDVINLSENRPALHTALRATNSQPILVDGIDITEGILQTREAMWTISNQIRQGLWLGHTGRPIKAIVNIGIGGSDLGLRFCVHALREYCNSGLSYHFVSDMDPNSFENATANLDPETTLFIIASKSFTTQETLYNAHKAYAFIGHPKQHKKHFIAVTVNIDEAKRHGIVTVLPIWEWVGGRYSLCSAINLITCIAIGYERFSELLAGANSMDRHFHHEEFHQNLPVIMALIGIWNINFLQIQSLLLLIYATQLEQLVPYVQQLDMESNGKNKDLEGRALQHATAPIVWGGAGNQAQHSYYQLLCQGTHRIAADFISTNSYENETINALCLAKMRILSQGTQELASSAAHIRGGMPLNHLKLAMIDPFCLGELIALYEHKIFVQGALWGINSFDQPGVESAKRFTRDLMAEITVD